MSALQVVKGMTASDGEPQPPSGESGDRSDLRAGMFWWSCQPDEGIAQGNRGGIGFWTPGSAYSVAWASDDAVSPTRTTSTSANVALLGLENGSGEIAMVGEIEGFDNGAPSIRWETRPRERWWIHYLALGGESLSGARVGVDEPGESSPHDRSTGDEGCDLLLTVVSTDDLGLSIGIGAASAAGSAAAAFASRSGASVGAVTGAQRRDAAVLLVRDPDRIDTLAAPRRGAGGVEGIEWDGGAPRRPVGYLALSGVRCSVGTANSPLSPARRRTRTGFAPDALVFFTWGLPASNAPSDIGRLSLGAATGGRAGCASWDDCDWGAQTAVTHVRTSSSEVVLVPNTQNGALHAAASLARIERDGFTLDWSVSDGKPREVVYVALAAKARPQPGGSLRRHIAQRLSRQRSASSSGL